MPRSLPGTKFTVTRNFPSSHGTDHSKCDYFVLDPQHDHAAREALETYADVIDQDDPTLAEAIRDWMDALDHIPPDTD